MPSNLEPLSLANFPKAILHIDGDCFFASCEIALDPKLRGKPVVTGKERGIASSMSYEAKAMGVTRGMSLPEIKKTCPGVIILPSDYETYSLFSMRMFDIVRRYTPIVEEYSIDECFADLTGLQRPSQMSYEKMAEKIKTSLDEELGITFSVGLAPTKVLAKVGSKWKKPSGLTIIPGHGIHLYLKDLPVQKIWGIGPATSAYLGKCGVVTALEFARKDFEWVKASLTKPHHEIWQELQGNSVYPVSCAKKDDYKSIGKTKTFTPASNDKEFVFSQLSKNIENACIKARRHNLSAKRFCFFIKTRQFHSRGAEIKLERALSAPNEIVGLARGQFAKVWRNDEQYRATGVILMDLAAAQTNQLDLFGKAAKSGKFVKIFEQVDKVSDKFGKHAVFLGSSFQALARKSCSESRLASQQHPGQRGDEAKRKKDLFRGETSRKRLAIPMLRSVS